jgi:hypothetical protein
VLAKAKNAEIAFVVSCRLPMVHAASFLENHADLALIGLADDFRDEWEHAHNWAERNRLLEAQFASRSEENGKRLVFPVRRRARERGVQRSGHRA